MRTVLGFALFILFAQAACGDDLDGESLIGATCKVSNDCDVTGVCVLGKDGLCSLKCEFPGAPQQCPLGSYCDERTVESTDETVQSMTLCFPACKASSDCRDGYECKSVTDGSGKVCVPVNRPMNDD
jgi:hypothetical protein